MFQHLKVKNNNTHKKNFNNSTNNKPNKKHKFNSNKPKHNNNKIPQVIFSLKFINFQLETQLKVGSIITFNKINKKTLLNNNNNKLKRNKDNHKFKLNQLLMGIKYLKVLIKHQDQIK